MLTLQAKEVADGLSSAEAARRLQTEGPNELPPARRRTTLVILETTPDGGSLSPSGGHQ